MTNKKYFGYFLPNPPPQVSPTTPFWIVNVFHIAADAHIQYLWGIPHQIIQKKPKSKPPISEFYHFLPM